MSGSPAMVRRLAMAAAVVGFGAAVPVPSATAAERPTVSYVNDLQDAVPDQEETTKALDEMATYAAEAAGIGIDPVEFSSVAGLVSKSYGEVDVETDRVVRIDRKPGGAVRFGKPAADRQVALLLSHGREIGLGKLVDAVEKARAADAGKARPDAMNLLMSRVLKGLTAPAVDAALSVRAYKAASDAVVREFPGVDKDRHAVLVYVSMTMGAEKVVGLGRELARPTKPDRQGNIRPVHTVLGVAANSDPYLTVESPSGRTMRLDAGGFEAQVKKDLGELREGLAKVIAKRSAALDVPVGPRMG